MVTRHRTKHPSLLVRVVRAVCVVFGVFGGLMAASAPASAQELFRPAARQGYFLGLGLRQGTATIHDSDLGFLDFMQSGALTLRAGQVINDWLGLGLALEGGGSAGRDWSGGYGALLLEGQYIPFAYENVAFRGAIGIAGLGVGRVDEAKKREDDPTGNVGALYKLGLSYDWFPFHDPSDGSGGFAITVFAETQLIAAGDLLAPSLFLGLEVAYWFGFDDSRLALFSDEAFDGP